MQIDEAALQTRMLQAFPPSHRPYVRALVPIIAALYRGELSRQDVESLLVEDDCPLSLQEIDRLVALECPAGAALSIGAQGQVGDVSLRDVAGRDIVHHNYFARPQVDPVEEERDQEEARRKAAELFSSATQAHLTGKYWEARRLFRMVQGIDPHYPQVQERIRLVEIQIDRFDRPIPSAPAQLPTQALPDLEPAMQSSPHARALLLAALVVLLILGCALGYYARSLGLW